MQTSKSLNTHRILLVISVVFSFAIRIPSLYYTSYWWRAIQTEMTAYWFTEEGIDFLNYQTPLFGPPWQIPLEFPLFQATAAALVKLGFVGSIGFASRITALTFFYLSALFLYLVCKEIFQEISINLAVISIYLWLPYNIYFSTETLIDYLALALAFGYFYFILLRIRSRSPILSTIIGTLLGSLSILVKPNTAPIVAISIIAFVLNNLLLGVKNNIIKPFSLQEFAKHLLKHWDYWFSLVVLAIIPLLAGFLWTRHSDYIKDSSIFTQWLTSKALISWNFGTWELRSNPLIWIVYIFQIQRFLLPHGLFFFGILGFYIAAKESFKLKGGEINLFVTSVGISAIVVFVIFLNLYRHEYYYISLSASTSILAGYGVVRFLQTKQASRYITGIFIVWAIPFLLLSAKDYLTFRDIAISETQKMQNSIRWSKEVQHYIPANKWVISIQYDWDPIYTYALGRKVMIVSPREINKPICAALSNEQFSHVVIGDPNYKRNDELLSIVLKCFKSSNEVMHGVYSIKH